MKGRISQINPDPSNIYQIKVKLKILARFSSKATYITCIKTLKRLLILVPFFHMHVHLPVNSNYLQKSKIIDLLRQRKIDTLEF